ncbi:kinase-like domain-containing protein [Umbelopsis sp. AD052]|nr:kinase-like domain-containing protein [Umbelopsis sp. AD052]
MINDYLIIKELGRGVHGKVKLAEDTERGGLVAIKVVDKESRRRQLGLSLRVDEEEKAMVNNPAEQKIQREIAILKKCVHPHVVMLFEVIDDPASRKIYMVLEYMEGGEIHWRDEDDRPILPIDDARAVFRDVVSGLDYLHYQGIVHRDIKPANLLLTADHVVKISDFGVSYFSELLAEDHHSSYDATSRSRIARELAKTAGSPAFFAPELCTVGDDMGLRITKAIDVWALGVTLYCLVFGRCPFEAETEYELFKLIPTQPLEFPADIEIEDDLRDLLCKLLTKDFEHRITLDQVRLHPWVTADLEDPELWKEEADPRHYKAVEVTDEEVSRAVTITEKIRRGIQRLSSSISHFTQAFDMKRKGKSLSSQGNTPQSHSPLTKTASSSPGLPTPEIIHFSPNRNKELPSLGGDAATPSNLTKLRNAQAQADASNVMPDFDDDRFEEADQESVLSNHHSYSHDSYDYSDFDSSPWPLERKDSSASTLSGLVIGRGRHRSTDADAT